MEAGEAGKGRGVTQFTCRRLEQLRGVLPASGETERHLSSLETMSAMSLRVWTTQEEVHKLGEALHLSLPRAPPASNSLAQLRESLPQRSMLWSLGQKARLGMPVGAGCCHKKESTGLMHCDGARVNLIRCSEGIQGREIRLLERAPLLDILIGI